MPRVLIVGGGLAGLATAYELTQGNFQVTILEAADRLGGRVRSERLWGDAPGPIDLGGELIGDDHDCWQRYARHFNLHLVPSSIEDSGQHGDGGRPIEALSLAEEMGRPVVEATLSRLAREVSPTAPWRHPEASRLDQMSVADFLGTLPLSGQGYAEARASLEVVNGVALERQSFLGLLAQVAGGGEHYWTRSEAWVCREGAQALADCLVAGAGHRLTVKLSSPVWEVERRADGVRAHLRGGDIVAADVGVLAVPPSAYEKISFSPRLPVTDLPQMGARAAKYLAKRPHPPALSARGALVGTAIPSMWARPTAQGEVFVTGFTAGPRADALSDVDQQDLRGIIDESMRKLAGEAWRRQSDDLWFDWSAEPFVAGGLSFPAPGEVCRLGPLWQQGLGPLHFVGDHTHFATVGYMEGALQSARRAAEAIARQHP